MQNLILANGNQATMSSREIAELTEKHHQHVKRDIESMLEALEKDVTSFGRIYFDSMNRQQTEYCLPKDLTITLVSGYSVKMRHVIVTRWQELEARTQHLIPQTLSEALRLAADIQDQKDKAEAALAIAAPKADALDRIALADGMLHLQAAGKALQQPPNKFIQWLREINWIYKRPGNANNYPRADKSNAGYMTVKAVTITQQDGTDRVREQTFITPKGLAKLSMMLGVQPSLDGGFHG